MHRERLIWSGDATVHLSLAEGDGDAMADRIVRVYQALRAAGIPGVLDLTPASTTVQIAIDPAAHDPDAIAAEALRIARSAPAHAVDDDAPRTIEIPVCYDEGLAPDLADIASLAGMSPREAAALHASAVYTVRFLGFSPGFAYLSGLPAQLRSPRLATPRPRVRAGSVGIADSRCGVYPSESPGGWRILGVTPLRMFDERRAEPCTLRAGDRVRFSSIDRASFEALLANGGRR